MSNVFLWKNMPEIYGELHICAADAKVHTRHFPNKEKKLVENYRTLNINFLHVSNLVEGRWAVRSWTKRGFGEL